MKKTVIVCLCLAVLSFLASCKKAEKVAAPAAFVVQSVFGEVKVERDGSTIDALAGQTLNARDSVVTGKKSTIDILCASEGVIRLNELTRISIESVSSNADSFNVALNLDKGKVFASIAKMKKDSSMSVKTPTAVAAVRGTSFRVSVSEDGSSVDVLSGKVQMNPVIDNKVIETVSTVVETNRTAVISVKDAKVMESGKKEITVVAMQPSAVEEIKNESSGISIAKIAPADLKQELDSVGIKSTEVDVKPIPPDTVNAKVPEPVSEVKTPEPTQVKDVGDSKAEKALAAKQEKERLAKEKADKALAEKQEKERLAKEQADAEQKQRELAAQEKAEKDRIAKEKAAKEQDQKESRVKNIPNM